MALNRLLELGSLKVASAKCWSFKKSVDVSTSQEPREVGRAIWNKHWNYQCTLPIENELLPYTIDFYLFRSTCSLGPGFTKVSKKIVRNLVGQDEVILNWYICIGYSLRSIKTWWNHTSNSRRIVWVISETVCLLSLEKVGESHPRHLNLMISALSLTNFVV